MRWENKGDASETGHRLIVKLLCCMAKSVAISLKKLKALFQ